MEAHPARTLGWDTRKLERVRCSSLVDWPVYPRLGALCRPQHAPAMEGPARSGRGLQSGHLGRDGALSPPDLSDGCRAAGARPEAEPALAASPRAAWLSCAE
jgi:hypothetical protein